MEVGSKVTEYYNKFQCRYVLLFVSVSCLFFSSFSLADDFTLEQLVAGVNLSREDIKSGELHLIISEKHEPEKTAKEAQEWANAQKQILLRERKEDPNLDPSSHSQQALYETKLQSIEARAIMYQDRREELQEKTVAFEMLNGNSVIHLENYRYRAIIKSQSLDPTKPYTNYENAIAIYNGEFQLYETEGKKDTPTVAIFPRDAIHKFDRYDQFGRTVFPISIHTAKLLGKEVINGIAYSLIGFRVEAEESRFTVRIWVDVNRGFSIYKQEYYRSVDSAPRLMFTILNEEFYEFPGGFWYPMKQTVIRYNEKTELQSESLYQVKQAEFNCDFPSNFFEVNVESVLDRGLELSLISEIRPRQQHTDFPTSTTALLECGPRSLLAVCEIVGKKTTFEELAKLSDFSPKTGTTMLGLYRAAQTKGLNPVGMKGSVKELRTVEKPVIAHVEEDHFLVVRAIKDNQIYLEDSVNRYSVLSIEEFEKIWGGYFLMFNVNQTGKGIVKEPENVDLAPRIYVDSPMHEFGEVLGGRSVEHTFTFYNRGSAILELSEVESSCRCTVGFLSEKHIPGGERGKIKVTLKVPSKNVEVTEIVSIRTNDPNQPRVELTVKAIAKTPLTTIPSRMYLGKFFPTSDFEKSITVRQNLERKAKIIGTRTTSDYIIAKTNSPKTSGNLRVSITVHPNIPIGNIDETLLIDYSHEGIKAAINIPILGQVLGDFEVFPRNLFFGAVDQQGSAKKAIDISSTRDFHLEILDVKNKSKYISTELITVDLGSQYQIEATINPEGSQGELVDHLVITTNSETQPEVTIPLYCIIKDLE